VPITELRKPGGDSSVLNNNGAQDQISRIVRETISEISKGTTRSATKEHDEKERQEMMHVLGETKVVLVAQTAMRRVWQSIGLP
jgi:hypothetical protein